MYSLYVPEIGDHVDPVCMLLSRLVVLGNGDRAQTQTEEEAG